MWEYDQFAMEEGYEVSTAGDNRFSPLLARLADGRTIEEAYQLDVKGYRELGYTRWQQAKGRRPRNKDLDLWAEYLKLWQQWAAENPDLIEDLRHRAAGKVLTDKFGSGNISQARALAHILNEIEAAQSHS